MTQYTKYSQNQNMQIEYSEILKDFTEMKPTFNPLLDICTIKMLGSYIYNKSNFEKWAICLNLIDKIIKMTNSLYSHYNLNNQDIIDIIKNAMCKNKDPSYIFTTIYHFVSDFLRERMAIADNAEEYFEMKSKYNESLDKIKLNYQDKWKNIEKEYDIISNILYLNFSELETDINFQITTDVIDSIGYEASDKVQILINSTIHLIKKNNILNDVIKKEFNIKMDDIYEKVIASKRFDKLIHDAILDMYGVQKEMHRMELSLEGCSYILNKLI